MVGKQVADLITLSRALLTVWFVWLGFTQGADGLSAAAWLLIINWTGDSIDGPLARRSRVRYQSWIGDHDLEVDMLVSTGLLIFMAAAGYVSWPLSVLYLLAWIIVFWRWDLLRSLGMLFQAPIYGYFILVTIRNVPETGLWLIGWLVAALLVTWPKFPKEIVPGFLAGMRGIWERRPQNSG